MSNDIAQAEDDIDKAVLELLLHSQQWPWSVEEVGREIGDRLGAEDALSRLARAGLAHRRRVRLSEPSSDPRGGA
jgi:predicted transcriptional regulator